MVYLHHGFFCYCNHLTQLLVIVFTKKKGPFIVGCVVLKMFGIDTRIITIVVLYSDYM